MFEWSEEEGRYMSAHHPFTLPTEDSAAELEGDLSKVRAVAYDIVLNGYELGGGSLRINHKELQERMLKALSFSEESAYEQFGFLLEAMDYGFPPHGGLVMGTGIGFGLKSRISSGGTDIVSLTIRKRCV